MAHVTAPRSEKIKQTESTLGLLAPGLIVVLIVIILGVKLHHRNVLLADTQNQLTQAKSQVTQTQTALDKAKADSADLQSELTKAKSRQSDLQSQRDEAKQAVTQLQTQLDKAKTESADLQTQLDKAKAQSADLQSQVSQGNSESAQLLTQLDQAKIQTLDLQSRLQKAESDLAQLQPMLLKARHLPVTTSIEKAKAGRSFTLHINNLYLQPLNVEVTITGSDKTRTQSNVIGSGASLTVEKLAPGEKVAIASAGYDPVTVTAE